MDRPISATPLGGCLFTHETLVDARLGDRSVEENSCPYDRRDGRSSTPSREHEGDEKIFISVRQIFSRIAGGHAS